MLTKLLSQSYTGFVYGEGQRLLWDVRHTTIREAFCFRWVEFGSMMQHFGQLHFWDKRRNVEPRFVSSHDTQSRSLSTQQKMKKRKGFTICIIHNDLGTPVHWNALLHSMLLYPSSSSSFSSSWMNPAHRLLLLLASASSLKTCLSFPSCVSFPCDRRE